MNDSKRFSRSMGPVLCGTLLARDVDKVAEVYCQYLEMSVLSDSVVSSELARGWRLPSVEGARSLLLESPAGKSWLRIIQQDDATAAKPISHFGWMSLEVLVDDVYQVAEKLKDSPFTFIGQPAKLDVSDSITACQVVGPVGEVLYLTSVAEAVPPFELPFAEAAVDRLFIPVLAVPSRARAIDFYQQLASSAALAFDTKVTVINRALGENIDRKIPVATIQLDGESLIEIDEVEQFRPPLRLASGLIDGIGLVTFEVVSLDDLSADFLGEPYRINDSLYQGRKAALLRGLAGELVELIERE